MRAYPSGACLIAVSLLGGCGGQSPSAPAPSGAGTSSAQNIVAVAVNQATMNAAMTFSPDGLSQTWTSQCPGGGSMSTTFTGTFGAGQSGALTTSSRLEFTDCRMQSVTINGDPAILMDGTYTFVPATGGPPSSVTSTSRMTGGLRFDAAGTPGRARYDCTVTISMTIGSNGAFQQPAITSSGTITWEQPLGTVSVRPCGR